MNNLYYQWKSDQMLCPRNCRILLMQLT